MQPVPIQTKILLFACFAAAYTLLYVWPNMWPIRPPVLLPLTALDRSMPFVPAAFLIYISDYVLAAWAILVLQGPRFWVFARGAFTTLLLSGTVFWAFPTTYPRPEYPVVESWVLTFTMELVRSGDSPNNAFPSMHVAMTCLCAWGLWNGPTARRLVLVAWSVAIALSTMMTKQHYFADVLGGTGVFAAVWLLEKYQVVPVHRAREAFQTFRHSLRRST